MSVKYPNVTVNLIGNDGNAFSVLDACQKAARKNKIPQEEIDAFMNEAMEGDYNHLLRVCMSWFNVEQENIILKQGLTSN